MRPLPAGWELLWDQPPKNRLHKQFNSICTWHDAKMLPDGGVYSLPNLWWHIGQRKWMEHIPEHHQGMSTSVECKSLRAFIRHLHKHDQQLRGYEVILSNRHRYYDVMAKFTNVK